MSESDVYSSEASGFSGFTPQSNQDQSANSNNSQVFYSPDQIPYTPPCQDRPKPQRLPRPRRLAIMAGTSNGTGSMVDVRDRKRKRSNTIEELLGTEDNDKAVTFKDLKALGQNLEDKIQGNSKRIDKAEEDLILLTDQACSQNLIFSGFKQPRDESDEGLRQVVVKFIQEEMAAKIEYFGNHPLTDDSYSAIHRIRGKPNPPLVLVKFVQKSAAQMLLQNARVLAEYNKEAKVRKELPIGVRRQYASSKVPKVGYLNKIRTLLKKADQSINVQVRAGFAEPAIIVDGQTFTSATLPERYFELAKSKDDKLKKFEI